MLETVGQRIKRLRKTKNWTQEQFAVRVNVSSQKVSNWERDYTPPSVEDVAKIAEICDTTSDFILTGRTEDQSSTEKKTANEGTSSSISELAKTISRAFHDFDSLPDDEKEFLLEELPETAKWKLEEFRKHKARVLEQNKKSGK
ncbi:helix-turn-helix domain-containing protein [Brevibacillus sp. FSL K6-0770]|uniref:helix-turn-helix domain-containing protein n=1 Tax=Brevibacillus sp. FSL K6-0770 TaxID=2954673 RepID=UPI0030F8DB35